MYIIANQKTLKLKEYNLERRKLFVAKILSNYGFGSFEDKMKLIQDEVYKLYGLTISREKATRDFFKQFGIILTEVIWNFLKDEDKKDIGVIQNLRVSEDEKIKFIEFYSDKTKKLCDLGGEVGQKVDPLTIQTFVAKHLGRSLEEMAEMDELVLINLLKEIVQLTKQERVDNVNLIALGTAYGQGNKSAKNQVSDMANEAKRSQISKNLKDIKPEQLKQATNFSLDEMRRLANGR